MRAVSPWLTAAMLLSLLASTGQLRAQVAAVQMAVPEPPCLGKVKRFPDGKLEWCILARDHSLAGHALPGGSALRFLPSGELWSCRLSRSTSFYGQALPAESTVFFSRVGNLRSFWLAKDTLVQGHLLWGHEDGVGHSLHRNGKLRAVWLARDEEIDGIPCTTSMNPFRLGFQVISLGTQRMVWFHDNGRLQQAMLSRDATVQGRAFKKGEIIQLDVEGKLDPSAPRMK